MKLYTARRGHSVAGGQTVYVDGKILDPGPSQKLRNHSPDGFEFGYGGSGPSQLALAILLDLLEDEHMALKLYQDFKWVFIASADYNGFLISSDDIHAWIGQRLSKEN